jgi:hypothetical protein
MTVSRATYISHTLELVGWDTLPAVAEVRYPTVEMSEQLLAEVDLVLFSSEPYPFKPEHLVAFAGRYNYLSDRLSLIDGEMTSWYGSRAIAGLEYVHRFAGAHAQPGRSE